jgi:Fe(3+) dicitrate transport protein
MMIQSNFKFALMALAFNLLPSAALFAQESGPIVLPSLVITDEKSRDFGTFRPQDSSKEVGQLQRTKKVSTTRLDQSPPLPLNQQRQLSSRTPGLLSSEVGNESFVSQNFRGIGDPHESYNVLVLEDGIPISADMFGYPAVYYTPPAGAVDSLKFYRGSAGLLFGPQPGGALDYKIKRALGFEKSQLFTSQTAGEFGMNSHFTEGAFIDKNVSVYGFFHRRGMEGFRQRNGDYSITDYALDLGRQLDDRWSVGFRASARTSDHGEPGGLSNEEGANRISYANSPTGVTTPLDRLRIGHQLQRLDLKYEAPDEARLFQIRLWRSQLSRYSKRQDKTTATFGGVANGSTNTIQIQDFSTWGLDARLEETFGGEDKPHRFSLGVMGYNVDSPFRQQTGAAPDAESGTERKNVERETRAHSFFTEVEFDFSNWIINPSLRVDQIRQTVVEKLNAGSSVPLRTKSDFASVALLGFGIARLLNHQSEAYFNWSQGYKPTTFQDTIPLGNGDLISEDIQAGRIETYEVGARSRGLSQDLHWDISWFRSHYTNILGRVGNRIQNVGVGLYEGLDAAAEYNLLAAAGNEDRLNLMLGLTLLDATFVGGPLKEKTPQYAPPTTIKGGLTYLRRSSGLFQDARAAFTFNYLASHFGDDGNTGNRQIPSYQVWDFSLETPLWRKILHFNAGVNNVFDTRYFSRVRDNGIEPAFPRNWFAGLTLRWMGP